MYTIFRFNRPQGNKKYATYEQARQAARKFLRSSNKFWKDSFAVLPWTTNPPINLFGYTIRKV